MFGWRENFREKNSWWSWIEGRAIRVGLRENHEVIILLCFFVFVSLLGSDWHLMWIWVGTLMKQTEDRERERERERERVRVRESWRLC